MELTIRPAALRDLEALTAIYNYEVEHGVATLDLTPRTLAERRVWLDAHNVDNHPHEINISLLLLHLLMLEVIIIKVILFSFLTYFNLANYQLSL